MGRGWRVVRDGMGWDGVGENREILTETGTAKREPIVLNHARLYINIPNPLK